jgi:hypothetical protein
MPERLIVIGGDAAEIACTGLTEAEATKAGFVYHAATVASRS